MTHNQEHLDTLTKEQRGEIWIKSILAKEPGYDVNALKEIWDETENTHETYEQEAQKMKWLADKINNSLNSGWVQYDDLWTPFQNALDKAKKKYTEDSVA